MRLFLLCMLFAALGCAAEPDPDPPITRACYRSFAHVLDAWTYAGLPRVSDECADLDVKYTVGLYTRQQDVPCSAESTPNGLVVGCAMTELQMIYIADLGDDYAAMTDTSIHEWIHALAHCVDGDADPDHLDGDLWQVYGADTVEIEAAARATAGECL